MKKSLLVLEGAWTDDLVDVKSVRPFLDGWCGVYGVQLIYRTYQGKDDLTHWVRRFIEHPSLQVCYVAGHGSRGRLEGRDRGINLNSLSQSTKKKGPIGSNNKGILLGACQAGTKLKDFLEGCGSRIKWVAGYVEDVPWTEATLVDLLFLDYLFFGRVKRDRQGKLLKGNDGRFVQSPRPKKASQAARWVCEDFGLANVLKLTACDRK